MRVPRTGGEFARGKSDRALTKYCLAVLGWCLLIFFLVGYLLAEWSVGARIVAATLALALFLPIFTKALYRTWVNWQKGIAGEKLVSALLPRLSDEYVLVNDVVLPRRKGNIDHVLAGPCGVTVIETKHYSGRIVCDGDRWFRNDVPLKKSPSLQAKSQAASLRAYLEEKLGGASQAIGYVEAIVVFTNPLVRLNVQSPTVHVVRFSELLELVVELGRKKSLSPQLISRVSRCVVSGSG